MLCVLGRSVSRTNLMTGKLDRLRLQTARLSSDVAKKTAEVRVAYTPYVRNDFD